MKSAATWPVPPGLLLMLTCWPILLQPAVARSAEREPWTTSRVQGSPSPPLPFRVERAFGSCTFKQPVELTNAPGTESMFLLEQTGRLYELASEQQPPRLVAELARHIHEFQDAYGFDFHPRFDQNREVYVCYTRRGDNRSGSVVSRFRMTETEPMRIVAGSEQVLYTWLSGGHNGGCVKFGPDGNLYVSAGDAAAPFPPDPLKAGQDLSNLLSTIVRINVDHAEEGRNYSIPADNPFVDVRGARPEIWCYGFRNPWRMAFDRETGDLWVGDVGWELWEMIYCVQGGGNYGWSIVEGPHDVHPQGRRGPTPILKPAAAHSHSEARSITGGQVYYGQELPELRGHYVYGDHVTGNVWSMRKQGGDFTAPKLIARAPLQIVSFGLHNNGELYIVDYAGTIHRLARHDSTEASVAFPRTLSESGLFTSVGEHRLAAGILPYSVIARPWMDGAEAERFLAIPGDARIETYDAGGGHAGWMGRHKGAWKFPDNTVLGKTISVGSHRVETQLLHYDGQSWQPYTYVWNDQQTDARLADDAAQTIQLAMGGKNIRWQISNRAECMVCHSSAAGMVLGFHPIQLNRVGEDGKSQMARFDEIGLFADSPPTGRSLTDPYDAAAPLDHRARSYLHVNCAHCHRREGGGAVAMDVVFGRPLGRTRLMDESPLQGHFGIDNAKVIAPGDPFRSVLYYRISKLGPGRMPRLGGAEVDAAGAQLLHDWIVELGANAGSPSTVEEAVGEMPESSLIEFLSDTRQALMVSHAIRNGDLQPEFLVRVLGLASNLPDTSRDLFEPFLAPESRTKRLGNDFELTAILGTQGDPLRGEELFRSESLSCKNCHSVEPGVTGLGPNLRSLKAGNYRREALLLSLVEPSNKVESEFQTHLIQTSDGRVISGVLQQDGDNMLVLRDAENRVHRFDPGEVELRKPLDVSMMPDKLLNSLTLQQAADLLEYLVSLQPKP